MGARTQEEEQMTDQNQDQNTPETFRIVKDVMPELEKRLAKLNKRGAKIGVKPFELVIEKEYVIPDPRFKNVAFVEQGIPVPKIAMVDVHIEGQGPKIEGWKFVGSLDHHTIPGEVLIKTVPGETIPPQYFNAEPVCDHCGHKRARKDTFILQNEETGQYQQIGRSCTKDFIGHDPERIARLLSGLWSIYKDVENDVFMGGGSYVEHVYNADEVLKWTIRAIELYGWVSKSSADETNNPTVGHVSYIIEPPYRPKKPEMEMWLKERARFESVADDEKEDAEIIAAREWLDEQPDSNEYMHNLKIIATQKHIPYRLMSFWTSMIAAYQRAAEKLKVAERTKKVNEYIGDVKQRCDFTVTVIHRTGFDSYYGYVNIVVMLADTGHTLVWYANTSPDMSQGEKYKIKGTVKKHEEYKEWKQTHLSRVKVLEELS
jgi:hypothetical protein